MTSLRRATARFLYSRPSASLSINARSFHSFRIPLARFPNQVKTGYVLQRRFASEEAVPKSDTEVEAEPRSISSDNLETSVESDSFGIPEDGQVLASSETQEPASEPKSFATTASETISNAATSAAEAASSAAETISGAASTVSGDAQQISFKDRNAMSASSTVYVGNIFFNVGPEDLREEFSKAGPILRVKLIKDERGMNKGFGYVDFETPEAAEKAIEMFHQQNFEGRRLNVQKPTRRFRNREQPINEPSKTVFIGNLPFDLSDRDLNNLFRNIKDVIDVRVAVDRRTGQPRGFAHAEFTDIESAKRGYNALMEIDVGGRRLRVDFSTNSGRAVMREGEARSRRSSGESNFQ